MRRKQEGAGRQEAVAAPAVRAAPAPAAPERGERSAADERHRRRADRPAALATLRGSWRGVDPRGLRTHRAHRRLARRAPARDTGAAVVGATAGLPPATVAAIAFVGHLHARARRCQPGRVGLRPRYSARRAAPVQPRDRARLFGLAKGGMLLAFVLLFLDLFPVVPEIKPQLRDSQLARPLVSVAETIVRVGADRAGAPARTPSATAMIGRVPDDTLQRIRERVSIVEVVSAIREPEKSRSQSPRTVSVS